MKPSYHSDTGSLYIHLSEKSGVDVIEVPEGFAVDIDADVKPVGIDIEANASTVVDLSRLELDGVSLESLYLASGPKDQKAVS